MSASKFSPRQAGNEGQNIVMYGSASLYMENPTPQCGRLGRKIASAAVVVAGGKNNIIAALVGKNKGSRARSSPCFKESSSDDAPICVLHSRMLASLFNVDKLRAS